jgi:hypothetical protein
MLVTELGRLSEPEAVETARLQTLDVDTMRLIQQSCVCGEQI